MPTGVMQNRNLNNKVPHEADFSLHSETSPLITNPEIAENDCNHSASHSIAQQSMDPKTPRLPKPMFASPVTPSKCVTSDDDEEEHCTKDDIPISLEDFETDVEESEFIRKISCDSMPELSSFVADMILSEEEGEAESDDEEIKLIRQLIDEVEEEESDDDVDDVGNAKNDEQGDVKAWASKITAVHNSSGNLLQDLQHVDCHEEIMNPIIDMEGDDYNLEGIDYSDHDKGETQKESGVIAGDDITVCSVPLDSAPVDVFDKEDARMKKNQTTSRIGVKIFPKKKESKRPKVSKINPMTGVKSLTDEVQEMKKQRKLVMKTKRKPKEPLSSRVKHRLGSERLLQGRTVKSKMTNKPYHASADPQESNSKDNEFTTEQDKCNPIEVPLFCHVSKQATRDKRKKDSSSVSTLGNDSAFIAIGRNKRVSPTFSRENSTGCNDDTTVSEATNHSEFFPEETSASPSHSSSEKDTNTKSKIGKPKPKNITWREITVGCRVCIYWKDDNCYYPCTVKKRGRRYGDGRLSTRFCVLYDDGVREWTDMADEKLRWCDDDGESSSPEETETVSGGDDESVTKDGEPSTSSESPKARAPIDSKSLRLRGTIQERDEENKSPSTKDYITVPPSRHLGSDPEDDDQTSIESLNDFGVVAHRSEEDDKKLSMCHSTSFPELESVIESNRNSTSPPSPPNSNLGMIVELNHTAEKRKCSADKTKQNVSEKHRRNSTSEPAKKRKMVRKRQKIKDKDSAKRTGKMQEENSISTGKQGEKEAMNSSVKPEKEAVLNTNDSMMTATNESNSTPGGITENNVLNIHSCTDKETSSKSSDVEKTKSRSRVRKTLPRELKNLAAHNTPGLKTLDDNFLGNVPVAPTLNPKNGGASKFASKLMRLRLEPLHDGDEDIQSSAGGNLQVEGDKKESMVRSLPPCMPNILNHDGNDERRNDEKSSTEQGEKSSTEQLNSTKLTKRKIPLPELHSGSTEGPSSRPPVEVNTDKTLRAKKKLKTSRTLDTTSLDSQVDKKEKEKNSCTEKSSTIARTPATKQKIASNDAEAPKGVKKKRGRPRKHPVEKRLRNPKRVAKKFSPVGEGSEKQEIYFGMVVSRKACTENPGSVWRVIYDDGNEEEFDKTALVEGLNLCKKYESKNSKNGHTPPSALCSTGLQKNLAEKNNKRRVEHSPHERTESKETKPGEDEEARKEPSVPPKPVPVKAEDNENCDVRKRTHKPTKKKQPNPQRFHFLSCSSEVFGSRPEGDVIDLTTACNEC